MSGPSSGDITSEAVITSVVLAAMFVLLARERYPPSGILLAGLTGLTLVGVVSVEVAFAGFANPAPLTVAALYTVAGGARRTGLLAGATAGLLGGGGPRRTLARLCGSVAGLSALFNNTPLVAMLVPEVVAWSRRRGLPVSRFLMPLSFAAILGGTVTLVGTSTGLVVSGVLRQQGLEPLGLFEQTPIGLPVALAGLVMMVVSVGRLIPDRHDPGSGASQTMRAYALHLEVDGDGPLVGQTVTAAGLRNLSGVYLADVVRGVRHIGPVAPDEVLAAGDLLVFVGDINDVVDLRARPGLRAPDGHDEVLSMAREPQYFEAVIGRESPLVSRTLKEVGGRSGYRAVAVAIHRAGERVGGKLGDVELRAGDTLVLLADGDLQSARRATEDFLVVAPLHEALPIVGRGARWVASAVLAFAVLAGTGLVSTFEAALVAAGIIVGTRVLTFAEAKRSVNLDVVLLVAAALGIGAAVETSGLADLAARALLGLVGDLGTLAGVAAILVLTAALTEIVTNSAAAGVVVPVALRAADGIGVDPRWLAIGVAVVASSSFLTPIGYQTNAMVYGPGGYRFADFARVGAPLSVVVVSLTTVLVVLPG